MKLNWNLEWREAIILPECGEQRRRWRRGSSEEDGGEKLGFTEVESEQKGVWNWDCPLRDGNIQIQILKLTVTCFILFLEK
jgi:hypothetical protein